MHVSLFFPLEGICNWTRASLFLVPSLVHSRFSNWQFHLNCHLVAWQGVLEAVRISLAGYPTRRTYAEFVDRFAVLVPELMIGRYVLFSYILNETSYRQIWKFMEVTVSLRPETPCHGLILLICNKKLHLNSLIPLYQRSLCLN